MTGLKLWSFFILALIMPFAFRNMREAWQGIARVRTGTGKVIADFERSIDPRAFWLITIIKSGLLMFGVFLSIQLFVAS